MSLSMNRLAIFLCLVGLTLAVCQAAEFPRVRRQASSEEQASAPAPAAGTAQTTEQQNQQEGGEFEEMDVSWEQSLSELAEAHFGVKMDCAHMEEMIAQAKTGNSTVDPQLESAFNDCKKELSQITDEIRTISTQMVNSQ